LHFILYHCPFRFNLNFFPRNFVRNSYSRIRIKFLESLVLPDPESILEPVLHLSTSAVRTVCGLSLITRDSFAAGTRSHRSIFSRSISRPSSRLLHLGPPSQLFADLQLALEHVITRRGNRRQHQSLPIAASPHFVCNFTSNAVLASRDDVNRSLVD